MSKRKLIADMFLIILLSASVSFSLLGFCSSSRTVFSGVVYASPAIPVEGASVTASGPEGYGSASTDALGHYSITTGLMTGNYTVKASANGYLDATIENVAVTGGLDTPNVNFMLIVSGAISGKVTDAISSLPLNGAMVEAQNATGGAIFETAFTDVNGDYLVNTNLATGTFNVTASSTGHIVKTVSGITVTAGVETKNVDLTLEKSGTISGTVTDSISSAPLESVIISASTAGGISGGYTITNASGKYSINTNLATGTYNVSAWFPDLHLSKTVSGIAITAGAETTADLALDRSGIISGRVTQSPGGQPVAGASVVASSGGFAYFGSAQTNTTGYYSIASGLGTGTYTVIASFGMAFNMTYGVSVVAGSETSVDMALIIVPSGTIAGRVTNSTGSPIQFATVDAEGADGSGHATTDANGNYTISSGLGTGTYTVNASATGYSMMSVSGVNVIVDQVTSNVNFQLSALPSGRISGTVEAEFPVIPEFPQSIFVFLMVASLIAVASTRLRNAKAKHIELS